MIKKIWLFFLSIIAILWIWTTFADVIVYDWPEDKYKTLTCIISEVDDYTIIVVDYESWNLYELSGDVCMENAVWKAYYFDKSVDINSINTTNIREKGILVKDADHTRKDNERNVREDPKSWDDLIIGKGGVWARWAPLYIESLYKIGYEPKYGKIPIISLLSAKTIRMTWLQDYPWLSKDSRFYTGYYFQYRLFFSAWLMTIIIETIILFMVSKLFWRENPISNRRLFAVWVLASTITLPLLWLVLPLFFENYIVYTIVWELFVTMIEAVILKYWLKISRWKAILASVVCNTVSYLLWLLIF